MAKMALVIGVSEYEPGLSPLPGAARDIEAMRRVLQHSDVGGFDDVKMLTNPDPQKMQEAIEALFSGRTKDDLVLLFFSGHGIKDDNGRLYLATRSTRKTPQGDLIRATAVPARFVQDIMSNSRSRRQIVILDCCFSGAFAEGWSAKDDGSVDVKAQLGGEGRAVLTSSTSTQYSFEQEGSDLSTYTRYLVEGIETGAADLDSDGMVSIDELHEYAKGKVREAAPAMKPEIYALKEGYKIYLAQAPTEDPKLRYRKEVEHSANRGEISAISRYTLDALRESLELSPEEAGAIEDEVLQPYRRYQKKLQRYEQVLAEALQHEHPLSRNTLNELKRLQRVLSLRDEDITQIETQITSQKRAIPDSNHPAAAIQPQALFQREAGSTVKLLDRASATSQSQSSESSRTRTVRMPAISVAFLRKPKLLIGAGITTAVALIILLLVKLPQPLHNTESETTASSTTSSNTQLSAQDFYNRGDDKYYKEDHQGAIEDYTQAIQLNIEYTEAYYSRGVSKAHLGDNQGAIADYDQAIKLDPNYTYAYYERGLAKARQGDDEGAIADYDQAIKLDPEYISAYYERGLSKARQGDNEGAIADYDQVIKLDPEYVSAYNERGNARSNLGDNQGAIADYDQAIKLDSNFAYAYNNRGLAKSNLGDNQGAIADYDHAIRVTPDYIDAYNNRGNARSNSGDNQGAIADYDQAIKLDPDYAHAYYNRGNSKSDLGDKQGAIADYQKAAELYQQQENTQDYQDAMDRIKELQ
jgi:tetratricopeptide (TPR) repeat protein